MTERDEAAIAPRRFRLARDRDISGVSGAGVVAHGVVWLDGVAALRWDGSLRSTAIYETLGDLEAIHGHDGATRIEWLD